MNENKKNVIYETIKSIKQQLSIIELALASDGNLSSMDDIIKRLNE